MTRERWPRKGDRFRYRAIAESGFIEAPIVLIFYLRREQERGGLVEGERRVPLNLHSLQDLVTHDNILDFDPIDRNQLVRRRSTRYQISVSRLMLMMICRPSRARLLLLFHSWINLLPLVSL